MRHKDEEKTEKYAYYGKLGCDSPLALLQKMLLSIKKQNPKLDVLFIPGDMVGHSYS